MAVPDATTAIPRARPGAARRALLRCGAATAAVVAAVSACGTEPVDPRSAQSDEILAAVVADPEAPGCSAAVGVDGEVVWAGARGVANMGTAEPITTITPIEIASTSKQFTATAVLVLVEAGSLDLDDTLADSLPGMPEWAADVTLAQLMTHTSGIADFVATGAGRDESGAITNDATIAWVATEPRAHHDAGGFAYSNTNYNLLAAIVARATGTPFDTWAQQHLFEPLGVEAHFWPVRPADAVGHIGRSPVASSGSAQDLGSGGIVTTPSDLVRWADHIRTSALVSSETLLATLEDAAPINDRSSYGPGLIVDDDGSLDHGGDGDGVKAAFGVSPDRHTAIAVSCNTGGLATAVDARLRAVWGLPAGSQL
jgi:CubicO group peptidase (beta-lactamase class C family)